MDVQEIRARIKKSIATVTGIDVNEIRDDSSYVADLDLDSLSILEIVVDVEAQFDIDAPEEELKVIRTIDDTVRFVQQYVLTKVD
jgi:acyl carrier protein